MNRKDLEKNMQIVLGNHASTLFFYLKRIAIIIGTDNLTLLTKKNYKPVVDLTKINCEYNFKNTILKNRDILANQILEQIKCKNKSIRFAQRV